MKLELVNRIANAVLYEGYMLYPYRPTAVKNQQRWNFGVLYPQGYSQAQGGTDASSMQTECLVHARGAGELEVQVRFLHLLQREIGKLVEPLAEFIEGVEPDYQPVNALEVEGQLFQSWQEATQRDVILPPAGITELEHASQRVAFSFPEYRLVEPLRGKDGVIVGVSVRRQERVAGEIILAARRESDGLSKITVRISNETEAAPEATGRETRDRALLSSTVSTHTILGVRDGEFVSLLDPPAEFRSAASACCNVGTWPVLVGEADSKDTMLSSPIILYDYPQIAPESVGDLFDSTEIDEILTLRIMTLTDEEKREMRGADALARRILERTEMLPAEKLMQMHGAMRGMKQVGNKG